jgi:DNA-3-methyladenine glycosylase
LLVAHTSPSTDVLRLRPLERAFFARGAVEVARDLLDVWLISHDDEGPAAVRIVETEAYGGPEDRASHARAGMTPRTRPMFGPPGHAYVYLIYGMHECLNVVTETAGQAGAVLLRAGEPVAGADLMRRRRGRPTDPDHRLAAGPARLCEAMGVSRRMNGHDLTLGKRLWIARPAEEMETRPQPERIIAGPRVGVAYAGEWASRPWRFHIARHPALSRP